MKPVKERRRLASLIVVVSLVLSPLVLWFVVAWRITGHQLEAARAQADAADRELEIWTKALEKGRK